jgi:hypothetical protein
MKDWNTTDGMKLMFALNFLERFEVDGHVDEEGVARWSDGHAVQDWQAHILEACGLEVSERACELARHEELGDAYAAYHRS